MGFEDAPGLKMKKADSRRPVVRIRKLPAKIFDVKARTAYLTPYILMLN
jgi:hypothetical protein